MINITKTITTIMKITHIKNTTQNQHTNIKKQINNNNDKTATAIINNNNK